MNNSDQRKPDLDNGDVDLSSTEVVFGTAIDFLESINYAGELKHTMLIQFIGVLNNLLFYLQNTTANAFELPEDKIKDIKQRLKSLKSKLFGSDPITRDARYIGPDTQVDLLTALIGFYVGDFLTKFFECIEYYKLKQIDYNEIIISLNRLIEFLNFITATLTNDSFHAFPITKLNVIENPGVKNFFIHSEVESINLEEYLILKLLLDAARNLGATTAYIVITGKEENMSVEVYDNANNGIWPTSSLVNFAEDVTTNFRIAGSRRYLVDSISTHYTNVARILGVIKSITNRNISKPEFSDSLKLPKGSHPKESFRKVQISFDRRTAEVEG